MRLQVRDHRADGRERGYGEHGDRKNRKEGGERIIGGGKKRRDDLSEGTLPRVLGKTTERRVSDAAGQGYRLAERLRQLDRAACSRGRGRGSRNRCGRALAGTLGGFRRTLF